MFKVKVHKRASRYLEKLPKPQKDKIKKKLKDIGKQPFQVSGIKPMVGDWKGYYRIRIWGYADNFLD